MFQVRTFSRKGGGRGREGERNRKEEGELEGVKRERWGGEKGREDKKKERIDLGDRC